MGEAPNTPPVGSPTNSTTPGGHSGSGVPEVNLRNARALLLNSRKAYAEKENLLLFLAGSFCRRNYFQP